MTNITSENENSSEIVYPSWNDWVDVSEGRALWIVHNSNESPTLKTFESVVCKIKPDFSSEAAESPPRITLLPADRATIQVI